jgi:hypothetical protein
MLMARKVSMKLEIGGELESLAGMRRLKNNARRIPASKNVNNR